jgi:CRP-like cAMP-binding protein
MISTFFEAMERICPLAGQDQELFRAAFRTAKLRQHDYLVKSGEYCRSLAFILSGYLRTFYLDEAGNEITTGFHGPQTFCTSYFGFYSRQPAFDNVQAIADCELLLLSYDDLQALYAKSLNINVMGRRILESACYFREVRLQVMITLPAAERYAWFVREFGDVHRQAQLQHIASYLGIKPETLSRVRRKALS